MASDKYRITPGCDGKQMTSANLKRASPENTDGPVCGTADGCLRTDNTNRSSAREVFDVRWWPPSSKMIGARAPGRRVDDETGHMSRPRTGSTHRPVSRSSCIAVQQDWDGWAQTPRPTNDEHTFHMRLPKKQATGSESGSFFLSAALP